MKHHHIYLRSVEQITALNSISSQFLAMTAAQEKVFLVFNYFVTVKIIITVTNTITFRSIFDI